MTAFTLGENWTERLLLGASLLHAQLALPENVAFRVAPTPETCIAMLNAILDGTYDPTAYFVDGDTAPAMHAMPVIEADAAYLMIACRTDTFRGLKLSGVYNGGLVFEDPTWALLTALALSRSKSETPRGEPIAQDGADLWARMGKVADEIRSGTYDESVAFAELPPDRPSFSLITVKGADISGLREQGGRTISAWDSPRYFELFKKSN